MEDVLDLYAEPCLVRRTISPARKESVQRARPSGTASAPWRRGAPSFSASWRSAGSRELAERGLEFLLDEATIHPIDRRRPGRDVRGDLAVRGAGIGREQDLGALQAWKAPLPARTTARRWSRSSDVSVMR